MTTMRMDDDRGGFGLSVKNGGWSLHVKQPESFVTATPKELGQCLALAAYAYSNQDELDTIRSSFLDELASLIATQGIGSRQ